MILKPPLFAKPIHGHPLGPDGGLVGCWPMNEGAYNKDFRKVFDLSGNGNTGTFSGDVIWKPGKFGPCIRTEGTDDYIDLGINTYDLGLRRNATFCVWIYIDDITPIGDSSIIGDYTDSLGFNLMIENSPTGAITAYVYPNNYRVTTAGGLIHEGWNFVCCVWDGVNISIYHDGIYKAQVALNGDVGDSAVTLKLGVRGDLVGDYKGLLDVPVIYNRPLSASENALLFREPFCMFERDPIELWVGSVGAGAPPAGVMAAHYYRHLMQGVA